MYTCMHRHSSKEKFSSLRNQLNSISEWNLNFRLKFALNDYEHLSYCGFAYDITSIDFLLWRTAKERRNWDWYLLLKHYNGFFCSTRCFWCIDSNSLFLLVWVTIEKEKIKIGSRFWGWKLQDYCLKSFEFELFESADQAQTLLCFNWIF